MTSKEQIFDPNKLEKLIIKNWTDFIDTRKLLNLLKTNYELDFNINPDIKSLTVSYCELRLQGICIWISYNIIDSNQDVNITNEFLLKNDGTIEILGSDNI
jgi:hypothetical protein